MKTLSGVAGRLRSPGLRPEALRSLARRVPPPHAIATPPDFREARREHHLSLHTFGLPPVRLHPLTRPTLTRSSEDRREAPARRTQTQARRASGVKVCAESGCPELTTSTYCTAHTRQKRAERETDRPSTTERGYGSKHQQLRAKHTPAVLAGEAICPKCWQQIKPGEPWDLGHTPDRTDWTGPEHQACNRATKKQPGGAPLPQTPD